MILHRIVEHIRDHSWSAVGLELVIVFVGVFLGIQVSNWNEDRKDSARAVEYLERIRQELKDDVETFDRRIELWGSVIEHGAAALASARDGLTDGQTYWDALARFYLASQWLPFNPANTTFEEMRTAGELGLIADAQLRSEVSSYCHLVEFRKPLYQGGPDYRKTVRALTPLPVQNFMWDGCGRGTSLVVLQNCDSPIPMPEAQSLFEEYLASPVLIGDLRFWVIDLDVTLGSAQRDRDRAAMLVERIATALQ